MGCSLLLPRWFRLDVESGYFGIYWYCDADTTRFTLHCTLAKWDVREWGAGPNFKAAMRPCFDHWAMSADVWNRLLSWSKLGVERCKDVGNRVLLFLRRDDAAW